MNSFISKALVVILFVMIVGCTPSETVSPKPAIPTNKPAQPTSTRSVPVMPTRTQRPPLPTATTGSSSSQSGECFTEIFEFDPFNSDFYSYMVLQGSLNSIRVQPDEFALWFNLLNPRTSIIFTRNDLQYEEVNVTLKVQMEDTQGAVKLICQYDPAIGWYEFNIRLDGTYSIKVAVLENNQVAYETLYEGETSKTYKNGNTNEFSANCTPNELHFDFNGSKGWALDVPDYLPHIARGQVGFGIESESSLPVKIGFEEMIIDESDY